MLLKSKEVSLKYHFYALLPSTTRSLTEIRLDLPMLHSNSLLIYRAYLLVIFYNIFYNNALFLPSD